MERKQDKPVRAISSIYDIENICQSENMDTYCIRQEKSESLELFFVKKKLDLHRKVMVNHFYVTIYRSFEKDGVQMLGSASISFPGGYSVKEVEEKLRSAYLGASFVENKAYPLAVLEDNGQKEETEKQANSVLDFNQCAHQMVQSLYLYDNQEKTWINSAELFLKNKSEHILNSNGVDVVFQSSQISGEFVTQSVEQEDVELYHDFCYKGASEEEQTDLSVKVKEALEMTKARSKAERRNLSGKMRIILSQQYVGELMDYYVENSSAKMIYAGYSQFKAGENVQEGGSSVNISLHSHRPYSSEGIYMKDICMMQGGILKNIHGDLRYSYYLGQKPTGEFNCVQMEAGKISMEEMKQGDYLHIVSFSDFQVDTLSGFFGGEIRLAYYKEGDTMYPVTGGTISGNLNEQGNSICCSKEMQHQYGFEGPMAIAIDQVTVG